MFCADNNAILCCDSIKYLQTILQYKLFKNLHYPKIYIAFGKLVNKPTFAEILRGLKDVFFGTEISLKHLKFK